MPTTDYAQGLQDWIKEEKAAVALQSYLTNLWYDQSVELVFFRRPLIDTSASEILFSIKQAENKAAMHFDIHEVVKVVKQLSLMELAPSRIDLGKLMFQWHNHAGAAQLDDFLKLELKDYIGKSKFQLEPRDVILYGFGRIGRLAARVLIQQNGSGEQLRLKAIVVRGSGADDLQKRADLLSRDSVHGKLKGSLAVDFEKSQIIVNGHAIQIIYATQPDQIDYTQYGINNALLIDNTGVKRDRDGLSLHLKAKGVDRVLLTAPGKGDIPNIVFGVNNKEFQNQLQTEKIWSAASCTTNAICPVIDVLHENFEVLGGHIETVHAYTNDQNLLDNFHPKYRRGRSAALNMVITETGADKAVSKVIPALSGKLTGNAVRVPTPDVSLAILNLKLNREITVADVNMALKKAALDGKLVEQIEFSSNNELVSSDVVGNPHASVVDGAATIVSKDNRGVVLYVWYDNEYGYTRQVIRMAKEISGVIRLTYY